MQIEEFEQVLEKDKFSFGDSFWLDDWEFQVIEKARSSLIKMLL
jgi:hypothetical protein